MQLRIKGNTHTRIATRHNREKLEQELGRIELSSTTNPKSIDIIARDKNGRLLDDRLIGIYELKDGALRTCFAEQSAIDVARGRPEKRPTTFDAPAGSGIVLLECQRMASNEPSPSRG